MNKAEFRCPHCGEIIASPEKGVKKSKKPIILGTIIGLMVGLVFDYFYFYIGVITDYFTFMPIVHVVAGLLLGTLVGWVIGERKKR